MRHLIIGGLLLFYVITQILKVSDNWQYAGIVASVATLAFLVLGAVGGFGWRSYQSRFRVTVERESGSEFIHVIVRPNADDQLQVVVLGGPVGAKEKTKRPTVPFNLDWRENTTGQPTVDAISRVPRKFDLVSEIDSSGFLLHTLHEQDGIVFCFDNPSKYRADQSAKMFIQVRSMRFHRNVFRKVTIYPPAESNEPREPLVEPLGPLGRLTHWLGQDVLGS